MKFQRFFHALKWCALVRFVGRRLICNSTLGKSLPFKWPVLHLMRLQVHASKNIQNDSIALLALSRVAYSLFQISCDVRSKSNYACVIQFTQFHNWSWKKFGNLLAKSGSRQRGHQYSSSRLCCFWRPKLPPSLKLPYKFVASLNEL